MPSEDGRRLIDPVMTILNKVLSLMIDANRESAMYLYNTTSSYYSIGSTLDRATIAVVINHHNRHCWCIIAGVATAAVTSLIFLSDCSGICLWDRGTAINSSLEIHRNEKKRGGGWSSLCGIRCALIASITNSLFVPLSVLRHSV